MKREVSAPCCDDIGEQVQERGADEGEALVLPGAHSSSEMGLAKLQCGAHRGPMCLQKAQQGAQTSDWGGVSSISSSSSILRACPSGWRGLSRRSLLPREVGFQLGTEQQVEKARPRQGKGSRGWPGGKFLQEGSGAGD